MKQRPDIVPTATDSESRASTPATPGSAGAASESPPFPVPDHTLIRRVGKASYGEVWLARNALGTLFAVAVAMSDATPLTISCPNITVPANVNLLVPVNYPTPTVSDNVDPAPEVTYSIPSGSGFPIGATVVTCTATDAAGNAASTTFTVTRAPLGFTGLLSPIGGELAKGTGGSFADPLRAFKLGSTIPVKFTSSCGGSPIATGLNTLQATKYSNSVDSDPVIDATPTDAATTENQSG